MNDTRENKINFLYDIWKEKKKTRFYSENLLWLKYPRYVKIPSLFLSLYLSEFITIDCSKLVFLIFFFSRTLEIEKIIREFFFLFIVINIFFSHNSLWQQTTTNKTTTQVDLSYHPNNKTKNHYPPKLPNSKKKFVVKL